MRLKDYLEARGESFQDFAERVGVTSQALRRIAAGGWPRLKVANDIAEASRAQPAPDGASVTMADLIEAAQEATGRGAA